MIEALTSIQTFLTNVCINVMGFFANLFAEKNYIALAAILVGFAILGIAIGNLIGWIRDKILAKPKT